MSLSKDGVNIFDNREDKLGLSEEAYYFIGGIMKHMKGGDGHHQSNRQFI